jgi:hypothetical protein
LKIDPIIVHLVSVNGPDWSVTVSSSGTDSNRDLSRRVLDVVVQIMALDLSKESDQDQDQRLLEYFPTSRDTMINFLFTTRHASYQMIFHTKTYRSHPTPPLTRSRFDGSSVCTNNGFHTGSTEVSVTYFNFRSAFFVYDGTQLASVFLNYLLFCHLNTDRLTFHLLRPI